MVVQTKLDIMHQMRQSGATLEEIGSRFGITREGARWLLAKHYGSTRIQGLLTTPEICRLAHCAYNYINKLKRRGVIQPANVVGRGRMLWQLKTVAAITLYIDYHRCPICHQPLSSNRQVYCSWNCYHEAHRYKNWPEEARKQHHERVKRWLAKNPEKVKQIRQREQARQQAKRSLQLGCSVTTQPGAE